MINQSTIESFVETRSSTCREVFSSLVANEDESVKSFLTFVASNKVAGYVKSAGLSVGKNWQQDLSNLMSIEDLFLIIEAENKKEASTSPLIKLLKLFRPISNIPFKFIGIDLNALPLEQQFEAGDGIFLAALHHSFKAAK